MTNTAINCNTASIEELKHAFYNRVPIEGIVMIGTHYQPHNDELCSGYLLRRTLEGKRLFPGIEHASFGPISATELREKNLLWEEGFFKALKAGIMLIGIGNGPLDEHSNRREHISCTQRTVRLLDLMRLPENRNIYGRLINYVNYEDGNGDNLIQCLDRIKKNVAASKNEEYVKMHADELDALQSLQPGSFAQNLKKGFEAAGDDTIRQSKIMEMAFNFYEDEVAQARMFVEAEKCYDKNERKTELVIPNNKNRFVLLEIKSDIPIMNKVVHKRWRENREVKLGVLFLHKSNGQFVLMPNSQHIIPAQMKEVVKILRVLVGRKLKLYNIKFSELEKNQIIDEIPTLHFDENTGIISNGSKTDPFVPGLIGILLTPQDVVEAVQIGLDTTFFPQPHIKGCKAGKCVKGACWMYNFGQQRCYTVRNAQRVSENVIANALAKSNVDGDQRA